MKEPILRFPGGVERDPAIAGWMKSPPYELRSIARKWWVLMRECGDDVRELIHDGAPTVCVGDAAFAYVNAFTSHVNVGFFNGAALEDPAGLLEGSGKRMRHVKLKPGRELNVAALSNLIDAAHLHVRARVGA